MVHFVLFSGFVNATTAFSLILNPKTTRYDQDRKHSCEHLY